MRRYQILFPVSYNDGSTIPEELIANEVSRIVDEFGWASVERGVIEGYWKNEYGNVVSEDMISVFVDTVFVSRYHSAEWFQTAKLAWEKLFKQDSIYITHHDILVIE